MSRSISAARTARETVALIKSQIEAANLGIQDIRCVKIGCLIGTYVGPELTLVAWKRK